MKRLCIFLAAMLVAGTFFSCNRRYRSEPVPQRDATISQEERVEELERTEKTTTGPWEEKLK